MSRMTPLDCMAGAIKAAANDDPDAALVALTGHFVGLLTALMEARGHDSGGEIKIDGGPSRDLTLHAVKARATPPQQGDSHE